MEKRLKILIATDYSEAASHAERYAVHLAKNTNSILIFLNIYQLPFISPAKPMEFIDKAEEMHASEITRLKNHSEALFRSSQIDISEMACEHVVKVGGSIGKQIVKEAEDAHADFIVIGTHGVTGFRKLFFGSHSWDVMKKSRIPVFAIPKDAVFTGIKNIVFGTEYREGEIPVLNFLVHVARMFNAEITVLHITNYLLTKEFEREMFEKFRDDLVNVVLYPKMKIRLMVHENISEGVHKYCEEHHTDLLVMSPEKPFLFESIFHFPAF